nr:hypothetical protein [Psychrobacter sp. PraFG1]UNK06257.1 hypothetical protein MN210_06745 [Psychrobacter sp. PraFG1]
MNNANNPTRVVIDLDGSLDELDDDDITLPDLAEPQDIPIIETPRVVQAAADTKPNSVSSTSTTASSVTSTPELVAQTLTQSEQQKEDKSVAVGSHV